MESLAPADPELVERARHGDTQAYGLLIRRHQELAIRAGCLITGDTSEAEDAAQDAFIKAFYGLDRLQTGASFRPWLLRIVANEARNRQTASRRRAAREMRAARERPGSDAAPSPEALVLVDERRRALWDALSSLREDDRLVLGYRFFFDLSEAEMAQALDCAPGTVKSRLSRALGRLRQRLRSSVWDETRPQEQIRG